jgi:L-asparaginase/beta-aspartyl-peptidase (threonine type)
MTYAVVIHGGAGADPTLDYGQQEAHMRELISNGRDRLLSGQSAMETVVSLVKAMEASGLYVAGKGSAPNANGVVELDASVMDGVSRKAGAVAAIRGVVYPVEAAHRMMIEDHHVMLAGEGATAFALGQALEPVDDPATYYRDHVKHGSSGIGAAHGTVGAVALDTNGHLAAATSAGGTFNKKMGRVGDTPLIGAGTWADDRVAVSCTGLGEVFIRTSAAMMSRPACAMAAFP